MGEQMDENNINKFRRLVKEVYPYDKDKRRSVKLVKEVSADRQLLDSCNVEQSGEVISRSHGNNPCEEALEDFEELVEEIKEEKGRTVGHYID